MKNAYFGKRLVYSICLCVPFLFGGFASSAEDVPEFRSDVIMQAPVGKAESRNYALRATSRLCNRAPRIPPHVHEFGGSCTCSKGLLRLIGKTVGAKRYAKVTYFEGPGQNHPPGVMAASNPTDKVTEILLVEWVPVIRDRRFGPGNQIAHPRAGPRR